MPQTKKQQNISLSGTVCHFGKHIADHSFSFISTMMFSKFTAHPRNKYINRALQINSNKVKGDGV